MDENPARSGLRRWAGAAALAAGGLLAGVAVAGTITATAGPSTPPSTADSYSSNADPVQPPAGSGGEARDESKSQRPDEHLLTGDTAEKVRAAALAKYPGATIQRVETDSDGVYEAHLVTADGKRVTVEVGNDFAVTGEETAGPR